MEKIVNTLGWIAMLLGGAAVALFFTPGIHPKIFMLFTILGFLSSTAYTMLNTRHEINKSILNPGLIGMLLSSVPLIILLVLKFSK